MTSAITVYKLKSQTAGIEKVINHNYPYEQLPESRFILVASLVGHDA
jgi:hypothetical protein